MRETQILVGRVFDLDAIQPLCLSGRNKQSRAAPDELSMSISVASHCALDINLDSVHANSFLLNHPKSILLLARRWWYQFRSTVMVETEDYLPAAIAIAGCLLKARTKFEPYRFPSGHWVKARRTFWWFKLLKPFFHMSQPCVEFHVNVGSGDVRDRTELGQPGWCSSARNYFFSMTCGLLTCNANSSIILTLGPV